MERNIDKKTVDGFGEEWERFDQSGVSEAELKDIFESYFAIFPWKKLDAHSEGFDLGCGSGRWAKLVAPKVRQLHCIDPSKAIKVAQKNLLGLKNCKFYQASADEIPLLNESMDFGYSLGVLHHVPDTQKALNNCVRKLKPNAPFLVYLYYSFENRPRWFRWIWKSTELLRYLISRAPNSLKYLICNAIAAIIYLPLARTAKFFKIIGFNVRNIPLSAYSNKSFYTMKTDALDRFGTQLEKRFTKIQIKEMMERAGLKNIRFSTRAPYWCAIGTRK